MKEDQPKYHDPLLPIPPEWPDAQKLFRMQIIAPLVDPLSSPEEKCQWRRWVTSRAHTLPNGSTRRISERTLRRWVAQHRHAGWTSLDVHPRLDRGVLRKLTPDLIKRAKELKRDERRRSVPHLLRMLELENGEPIDISPSALWRHLAKAGLGSRRAASKEGLRRFEAEAPNALWQSDVHHGPYLPDPLRPGSRQKTYLIGFLDDYSRLITHAEWYWAEDVYALELCLQKALLRKGRPHRLYVDRGMIYQSHVLRSACAALNIRLIHGTAYHPEGRGKLEKFWQNVNNEFLLELEHSPVDTLDTMNRRFWAWLEEVYHRRTHSETKASPLNRFLIHGTPPLLQHPQGLAESFLWRVARVADKTGVVRFEGNAYQLAEGLERRRVELRYHPLHLQRLQVWIKEQRFADAVPVDLHHARVKQINPRHVDESPPSHYLEALVRRHEAEKRRILSPLVLSGANGEHEEEGTSRV